MLRAFREMGLWESGKETGNRFYSKLSLFGAVGNCFDTPENETCTPGAEENFGNRGPGVGSVSNALHQGTLDMEF